MTTSFIPRLEANALFVTVVSLNAEVARASGVENMLAANFGALTTNLSSTVATITANLANEVTSRINGDATLTTNLNAEITNRGDAIILETNRALAAEMTLTTNVATVTANLNTEIATHAALSVSLQSEISRATLAEVGINSSVVSTFATLTANMGSVTTNLATVTANLGTLMTNVATVTANLNTEVTARTALGTSVTSEVTRATASETALAVSIASVNSTWSGGANVACSNSASSSSTVGTPEYWMDNSVAANETIGMTIVTANLNGYVLKVLGVGFSMYYNPQFQVSFQCIFYNPAFGNKTTFGVVLYDPVASFLLSHVECPVPIFAMALPVTISLYKSTGQLYPFGGFINADILTVQYYWTSVAATGPALGNTITVTGLGFNVLTSKNYKCIFTGKNSTNGVIATSYFNTASNLTTLNCGLTPAGFAVVSATSTANLTIFEANADNSTGYQVQPTDNAVITFSTCLDGAKDGDETDVDCGGSTCGLRCAPGKSCLVTLDCTGSCVAFVCSLTSTTTTTTTTSTTTTTKTTTTTALPCFVRVLINGYDPPANLIAAMNAQLSSKYPLCTVTLTGRTNGVYSDVTKANFDVVVFWTNGGLNNPLSPYLSTFSAAGGGIIHSQFTQSVALNNPPSDSIFSVSMMSGNQYIKKDLWVRVLMYAKFISLFFYYIRWTRWNGFDDECRFRFVGHLVPRIKYRDIVTSLTHLL